MTGRVLTGAYETTTTTYDPLIGEERELRCRYWR